MTINRFEGVLARARQADGQWRADYRASRPKIERKIAHLMRRKHGGRRARVRGLSKVAADFKLLVAAVDCARLATLGLRWTGDVWTVEAVRPFAGFEATAINPSHRVGICSGLCSARRSVYRSIAVHHGKDRPSTLIAAMRVSMQLPRHFTPAT